LVEPDGKLACRQHRIATKPPGKTDMGVFAKDLEVGIAEVAGHPGADADRDTGLDQLRGLLDMQFDKGPDGFGAETCLSPADGVRVAAALGHVLGKRAT